MKSLVAEPSTQESAEPVLFPKVVPGYKLYANLIVALHGLVILVAAVPHENDVTDH